MTKKKRYLFDFLKNRNMRNDELIFAMMFANHQCFFAFFQQFKTSLLHCLVQSTPNKHFFLQKTFRKFEKVSSFFLRFSTRQTIIASANPFIFRCVFSQPRKRRRKHHYATFIHQITIEKRNKKLKLTIKIDNKKQQLH